MTEKMMREAVKKFNLQRDAVIYVSRYRPDIVNEYIQGGGVLKKAGELMRYCSTIPVQVTAMENQAAEHILHYLPSAALSRCVSTWKAQN